MSRHLSPHASARRPLRRGVAPLALATLLTLTVSGCAEKPEPWVSRHPQVTPSVTPSGTSAPAGDEAAATTPDEDGEADSQYPARADELAVRDLYERWVAAMIAGDGAALCTLTTKASQETTRGYLEMSGSSAAGTCEEVMTEATAMTASMAPDLEAGEVEAVEFTGNRADIHVVYAAEGYVSAGTVMDAVKVNGNWLMDG